MSFQDWPQSWEAFGVDVSPGSDNALEQSLGYPKRKEPSLNKVI